MSVPEQPTPPFLPPERARALFREMYDDFFIKQGINPETKAQDMGIEPDQELAILVDCRGEAIPPELQSILQTVYRGSVSLITMELGKEYSVLSVKDPTKPRLLLRDAFDTQSKNSSAPGSNILFLMRNMPMQYGFNQYPARQSTDIILERRPLITNRFLQRPLSPLVVRDIARVFTHHMHTPVDIPRRDSLALPMIIGRPTLTQLYHR